MLDAGRHGQTLSEILEEWDKAEADIKRAEQVCENTLIPSIMELRYAGRRLADALAMSSNGGDPDKVQAFLEDARFGCHCARHDAIDTAMAKIASEILLIERRLGPKAVLTVYPDFGKYWAKFYRAQKKIVESREKRDKRDEIYAAIAAADFEALVDGYRDMTTCLPMMKKLAFREDVSRYIGYGIGIVGVIAGFVIAIFF